MQACGVGATALIVYTQDLRFAQWTPNNEDIVSLGKTQVLLGNRTRQEEPNQLGNLDVN